MELCLEASPALVQRPEQLQKDSVQGSIQGSTLSSIRPSIRGSMESCTGLWFYMAAFRVE